MEHFAIALSEKNKEEAVKEAALKIKSIFPKSIKYILIFFTPHYNPATIFKTIGFTLNPKMVVGMQAPLLIFEDRIIEKGIIACCINKKEASLKEIFIKKYEPQDIEAALRISLQKQTKEKPFALSMLSHQCSPLNYLRGVTLSFGKAFNTFGAGFIKRYSSKNYQIINNLIDEGLVTIIGEGLKTTSLKIGGFFPIGKPFIITRVLSERNIVMEINGEPAINIYKHYFEEKFDIFKRNHLFPLYPLGVKQGDKTYLLNVIECLTDGSLVCIGEIKKNAQANLMLMHPPTLICSLKAALSPFKNNGAGVLFMINSLPRKKILRDAAAEEIKVIHQTIGDKFKTFGVYSDYLVFLDKDLRKNIMETGTILLTSWE